MATVQELEELLLYTQEETIEGIQKLLEEAYREGRRSVVQEIHAAERALEAAKNGIKLSTDA